MNQIMPTHRYNVCSNENIAAGQEIVSNNTNLSISRRLQELSLSSTSTWRIFRKD